MAEEILEGRLAVLAGLLGRGVLDAAEHQECRRLAVVGYGEAVRSAASYVAPVCGGSVAVDAADTVAALSPATRRELGALLVSKMADGGAAFRHTVEQVADAALASGAPASASLLAAEAAAAAAGTVSDAARGALTAACASVVDASAAQLRHPKTRGKRGGAGNARLESEQPAAKRRRENEAAAAAAAAASGASIDAAAEDLLSRALGEAKLVAAEATSKPPPPPPAKAVPPPPPPAAKKHEEATVTCEVCGAPGAAGGECDVCGAPR